MYKPKLPILDRKAAHIEGFESLTSPVDMHNEHDIIRSMENSMRGVKACWIKSPTCHQRNGLELARLKSQTLK